MNGKVDLVSTVLLAIGKEITLASNINPIRLMGSDKLLLAEWCKDDGTVFM